MTTPHERANEIHARWQAKLTATREDARLTAEGRMYALAPAYLQYTNDLATLQQTTAEQTQRRAELLTRTAFGVPRDPVAAMSYRDALGRAETIDDPRIASQKLTEALETGDSLMAQALARHASQSGWNDVVQTYTQTNPQAGIALGELQQIRDEAGSAAHRMMDGFHFAAQKPAEFQRLQDHQIYELANPAETVA